MNVDGGAPVMLLGSLADQPVPPELTVEALRARCAESTGKQGRAVIPVDRERLGSPHLYGSDRLLVYVRLDAKPDAAQDDGVLALEKAGLPVVRIRVADPYELGAEFFRWEIATAVAGAVLGINPFDQPHVEAAKIAARKVTPDYERTGALPPETPLAEEAGLRIFTDERNASELTWASGGTKTVEALLRAHLQRVRSGDYFALLAFVPMNARHEALLQQLRHRVRDRRRVASASASGRASCTRPARPTREVPAAASSCR